MELFFCCLGNGISVSDKSKNHESVCHISEHGHIQWHIEKNKISDSDLAAIISYAERKKAEFVKEWNKKTYYEKWEYMMNIPTIGCGFNAFTKVDWDNRRLSIEERVKLMEPVFFETHM